MSGLVEFDLAHDGRTQNASEGLRALAASMGKDLGDLGEPVSREMKRFLEEQMAELAARHGGQITTSTTLARRTGKLTAALKKAARVRSSKSVAGVRGEVRVRSDRSIHEFGGQIKPKSGQYVAVPLPAALTSSGKPKKRSPSAWKNTFTAKSRNGNVLIFQRKGKKLVPLYALKKSVRVPPRLGAAKTVRRNVDKFADRALSAIIDSLFED